MAKDNDPLDGFHGGIRSFYVTGSALAVQRSWNPGSEYEPDRPSEFTTRILGRCALDKGDHVRIIGTKTLVREFDLHIGSDEHAAYQWKRERGLAPVLRRPTGDEAMDKLYDHFFQTVMDEGDKESPTAQLHRIAPDSDIGNGEMWTCSVMVAPAVIAALEADLIAGRVETVNVGIKWSLTLLADEYSPVSASNIWGILPRGAGFLGEGLIGHVSGLWWRPKLGPVASPTVPPPVAEPDKRKRWP